MNKRLILYYILAVQLLLLFNFFTYIEAVREIVQDIPFSKRVWQPVNVSNFKFMDSRPTYYSDVIVEGWPGNFHLNRDDVPDAYQIDPYGHVSHQESLNAVLTGKSEGRLNAASEVTFKMDYMRRCCYYTRRNHKTSSRGKIRSVLSDGCSALHSINSFTYC